MSDDRWHSVGVDVGGTWTRVVAFEPSGGSIAESVSSTPTGADALATHLAREVAKIGSGRGRLRHVGVGVPGRVTADGVVSMALNVGIDEPVALADRLTAELDVPVAVENDVNAAAVAALAATGTGSSVTYLSIGTGFAAGSIVDGTILRGTTGVAGELGHVPIPGEPDECVCGQTGCIEAIASGRALSEAAARIGLGAAPTAVDLWDAADAGDSQAAAVRDRAVGALAWTAQVVVLALDVDHVVFGGGVSVLGERLLAPIRAVLAQREAASPWLAAVGPSRRLSTAPPDTHLGAVGADLAARARFGPTSEEAAWKS